MIRGNQRRALTACRDVSSSQIINDGTAREICKQPAEPKLHGQAGLGLVKHGLAMKADDVDCRPLDARLAQELRHGGGMMLGQFVLGARQRGRPLVARREPAGIGNCRRQQFAASDRRKETSVTGHG